MMPNETAAGDKGQWLYRAGGGICLGLATIGAVLPLLRTTPFLLLAAWLFSKSSPALHDRLYRHPRFGPILRGWQEERAIPPQAKAAAIAALLASGTGLILTADAAISAAGAVAMAPVGVFIITRPSPRRSGPRASPQSTSGGR